MSKKIKETMEDENKVKVPESDKEMDLGDEEVVSDEESLEPDGEEASSARAGKKAGKGVKTKKKKKQQRLSDKENKKLVIATVAVILAFVTFFVLTVIQDRIVNGSATSPVVVAIKEVPVGVELNEQNMSSYFSIEQRAIDQIPNTVKTYPNARDMIGKVTDRVVHAREIVTGDCFVSMGLYDGLDEPVEISLDLGAIGKTVGGVLRAGDYVDIKAVIKIEDKEGDSSDSYEEFPEGLVDIEAVEYVEVTDDGTTEGGEAENGEAGEDTGKDIVAEGIRNVTTPEKKEENLSDSANNGMASGVTGYYVSQLLAENVRVTRVFSSGGEDPETAEANGTTMVATVINIAVPKSKVDAILIAQQEGVVSLVRLEQPDNETEGVTE